MDVNNIKKETQEALVVTVEINGIQQDQIELANYPESDLSTTSAESELLPDICDIKLNDPTEIEIASSIQTELAPIEIHNIRINDETEIEDSHILHSRSKSSIRARYENNVNINEIELREHLRDNNGNNIKTEVGSDICHLTNDVIKVEDTTIVNEKTNVNVKNEELYCDNCHDVYEDYCTKCPMVVHILNGSSVSCSRSSRIPKKILEIRKILTSTGVFSLKVIPKGVQFGPYTGLSKSTSERFWKIKQGKFVGNNVQSNFLHWMWHINPARNIAEANLIPFQYKNSIYYHSTCDIQQGEELLVYFHEECVEIINDEIERNFTPITEKNLRDVFACTFCCLGFSSRVYLAKHKTVCCNGIIGKSLSTEITQCLFCKIYMDRQEYRQYHVNHCSKKYTRKRRLPMAGCQTRAEERRSRKPNAGKKQHNKIFNCLHCKYKTKYNGELKAHSNIMHYRVKAYKCRICPQRFKRKQNLKFHVLIAHIHTDRRGKYQCLTCEFKTYDKWCLNMHTIMKHKTGNNKNSLKRHALKNIKVKRLDHTNCAKKVHSNNRLNSSLSDEHMMISNQFTCADCNYKTTKKQYLKRHIDAKHLQKEKCKSKCDTVKKEGIMEYRTVEHSKQEKFRCLICGYKAFSRSNLIRHKYTHTKEKPLKCSSCNYRTYRNDSLKAHFEVMHEKVKRFKCSICDYQTHRNIDLTKHVKNEHETLIQLKCAHCKYKTTSKGDFKKHMNVRHSSDRNFKCSKCQFESTYFSHLIRHMYTHEKGRKPFKCSQCDYETHRLCTLDTHWLSHSTVKSFKCIKCEFAGKTKNSLRRHIVRMHLKSEKHKCREFDCESVFGPKLKKYPDVGRQLKGKNSKRKNSDCKYETRYLPHLKLHMQTQHCQLRKKYKCLKCDFKSAYKYVLKLHVPVHDEDKKFHCPMCNLKTHRRDVLKQHIKNIHEATKLFECSECEYQTVYQYSLKTHTESRHSEVKRYKCSKCDFQTVYKGSLEQHLRTHAKVKEFKCTKCKYETNVKKKLNVHMQVKHEGKKYECAKCEFKTGYKDSLKAHLELHDNVKKFKCSHCDFKTNYKKTINKHTAKKH